MPPTSTTESWQPDSLPPLMGGTLNATTEQAAEQERQAVELDRNRTLLSHDDRDYARTEPGFQAPLNAATMPTDEPSVKDPFADLEPVADTTAAPTSYAATIEPPHETLADIDQHNRQQPHDDARAAVEAAFGTQLTPEYGTDTQQDSFTANLPEPTMPPLPPLPDFSTLPPLPDLSAPNPNAGALPPEKLEEMFGPAPSAPVQQTPSAPGQFQIPGQ